MSRIRKTDSQKNAGRKLAEKIQDSREEKNLKQTDLAKKARISIDTLRKLEGGKIASPNVFLVAKLAKILEKDIREWLS